MLGKLKQHKVKSATIIETIVAMLILMISFSAGMVIYNKILGTGINDLFMHADMDTEIVTDSISKTNNRSDMVLSGSGWTYEIKYKADERYPGLMVMSVVCRDSAKKQLAENLRLIKSRGNGQD